MPNMHLRKIRDFFTNTGLQFRMTVIVTLAVLAVSTVILFITASLVKEKYETLLDERISDDLAAITGVMEQRMLRVEGMTRTMAGLIALVVCMQLFAFAMIILTGTLRTIQPIGSILKGLGDDRGTVESLGESTEGLKSFLLSQGLEKEKAVRYVLCAEELLKNIIQHGHARYVDIRATRSAITIHDDGKPFNPIEYRAEDEGIGLKIVHGFGLNMKYDFRFNQNMITVPVE